MKTHGRYPRVGCAIIGCRCGATCYPPSRGLEIICPKHYRLVDKQLKARRRRFRRLAQKHRIPDWRRWQMEDLIWSRMKRQATERSAGI